MSQKQPRAIRAGLRAYLHTVVSPCGSRLFARAANATTLRTPIKTGTGSDRAGGACPRFIRAPKVARLGATRACRDSFVHFGELPIHLQDQKKNALVRLACLPDDGELEVDRFYAIMLLAPGLTS